jgi:Glutaminyl-tRNA synthetase, non-specific RNA binding region part 1
MVALNRQSKSRVHFLLFALPGLNELAAVEFLKTHPADKIWVESDFEAACGIGVNVTQDELQDFVSGYISANKEKILKERYKALPATLKELSNDPTIKWADPKLRTEVVNGKFAELLGPKDERDTAPVKKVFSFHPISILIVGKSQSETCRINC